MAESTTLLTRIGSLFKRNRLSTLGTEDSNGQPTPQIIEPRRGGFFGSSRASEQSIQKLSEVVVSITQLMSTIRDNLERQNSRQDELLSLMARLPEALEQLPESHRLHGETLKAIYQQLGQQNASQEKLGEILSKMNETGGEQRKLIDSLNDQLDGLRQTDASISDNLVSVGTAMQSLSKTSQSSANVLERIQGNIDARNAAIEQILARQNQRFNFILWLSVVLSMGTLISLALLAYVAMYR